MYLKSIFFKSFNVLFDKKSILLLLKFFNVNFCIPLNGTFPKELLIFPFSTIYVNFNSNFIE